MIGRSFRTASTSVASVWSSVKVIDALPSVFLMARFVSPMIRSQKPPYHGARFGINFHSTPCRLNCSFSEGDLNRSLRVSEAARNVEALSDIM